MTVRNERPGRTRNAAEPGAVLACLAAVSLAAVSLAAAASAAVAEERVFPGATWETALPAGAGLDAARLEAARDFALAGGGAGFVVRGGRRVFAWGDTEQRFDLKSTTKSFGTGALALALADGKVRLDDRVVDHHPSFAVPPAENTASGWIDRITVRHLAQQTAGFAKPGGYERLLFEPGTRWAYSDGGPNWLAELITLRYRRDLAEVMAERVFAPIGIGERDLTWRRNQYRPREIDGVERREFGAGIHANVDAMARYGWLWRCGGRWGERQILPAEFVARAPRTDPGSAGLQVLDAASHPDAARHYGLLFWNNDDGRLAKVPRDAFWSWGLHESLIVVIPSLDLVVARAGPRGWLGAEGSDYARIRPFLEAVVAAVVGPADWQRSAAPHPPSKVVLGVAWAPVASVVRLARGSDNWPAAWGDDDRLYTAYGDGRGFEPFVERKLSLGLARVDGTAGRPRGENLRSAEIEQTGDGASGGKASGIVMVDGVLWLWVRNLGNARLAVSRDHGSTWTWADWRFAASFGCPTFLQFGRDYAGARDEFVYTYSHDAASAYEPADRMVLARAPKRRLLERPAYEFFAGLGDDGRPRWSSRIEERAAAFEHVGRCWRSGITFDRAIGRYLWCQTLPGGEPRFAGGFGIYDAPEPWGPWTTVYFTEKWDIGPGETSHFPSFWMSADGRELALVFSGDDAFSVRRAELTLARE